MQNTSNTQATVETAISSIFSREDVLRLLKQQQEEFAEQLAQQPVQQPEPQVVKVPYGVTREMLESVAEEIIQLFSEATETAVNGIDFDDAIDQSLELSIGWDKRIEVSVDGGSIAREVEDAVSSELPDADQLVEIMLDRLNLESPTVAETTENEPQDIVELERAPIAPNVPRPDSIEYADYLAAQAQWISDADNQ